MAIGKYGNIKTAEAGYTFDSLAERQRYCDLCLLEKAGEIEHLRVHPRFTLQDAFTRFDARHVRAIVYVADFMYLERGRLVVEDVKGGKATRTQVFEIKQKMFWLRYPDIELRIIES